MRLVYFSPVAWDSYEQRPHYFARDFLTSGGATVDWVDPYPARLPAWRDVARLDPRAKPLVVPRPPGLTVHQALALPIDPLPGGARVNRRLFWRSLLERLRRDEHRTIVGIGRPTALALEACDRVPAARRFYDAMDDFPEFYHGRSREATARVEKELASRVDRVVVSSTYLEEKFARLGHRPVRLSNAYDMSLLPPLNLAPDRPPTLGFIGCLGSWFDWDVVTRTAEAAAPVMVTLAGPVAAPKPRRLPSNIQLLPPCSQDDGVRLMQSFGAGLIPFKKNALTAGVDPIKFYQYRGMGLPVLTTRFGEMATRNTEDATFFLDDAAGPAQAIAAAAAYHPAAAEIARVRREDDWRERFAAARLWSV